MRLLVCGSRTWSDVVTIYANLNALAPTVLIHGAARGADAIADRWVDHRIVCLAFPADWKADGRRAGPRRNAKMLAESAPDQGLAFGPLWRVNSDRAWVKTGTGDMVARMLGAGVPVRWVAAPRFPCVDLPSMPDPRVDALAHGAA